MARERSSRRIGGAWQLGNEASERATDERGLPVGQGETAKVTVRLQADDLYSVPAQVPPKPAAPLEQEASQSAKPRRARARDFVSEEGTW